MNIGIIITCAVITLAAAAAVGVFLYFKFKVRLLSRSMFGTDSFMQGVRQQQKKMSETPMSVHSMTEVYLPQILRDFPEFDYELYKNKAQSLLKSYFVAIGSKKVSALAEECSLTLKNSVQSIIEDLNSRNVTQVFSSVVIHDVQISRYIKDGKTVTIMFEISVGYYSYSVDEQGNVVFGDKEMKSQTIYEVGLVYVQDADKVESNGEALGINCPNCGAPIKNLGSKFCEYCGSGIVEVNLRAWKFNSVREQTTARKQY